MKKAEIKQKLKELIATRAFKKACGMTLCVLAFLVVLRLFLLVFPIRSFEIEGDTYYSINEIIDASKLRSGSPLYGINESKAKKNILKGCPYITDVKIKQKFPGKVCFVVEEGAPGWYIQVGTNFYALDYDLKVLLESYSEEDMILRGLTKLELPELESVIVGEYPSFGKGDELLHIGTQGLSLSEGCGDAAVGDEAASLVGKQSLTVGGRTLKLGLFNSVSHSFILMCTVNNECFAIQRVLYSSSSSSRP